MNTAGNLMVVPLPLIPNNLLRASNKIYDAAEGKKRERSKGYGKNRYTPEQRGPGWKDHLLVSFRDAAFAAAVLKFRNQSVSSKNA